MSEVISSFKSLRVGPQVFTLRMLFLFVILHTMWLMLLYALFNHPHMIIHVARVQKAQLRIASTGLSHKFTGDKSLGEMCNRTGAVHPVDPFHSLDNLKNHFASIAF